MRFVSTIVFLFLTLSLSVRAQSNSTDNTSATITSRYLLTPYLPSGEVIVPTGRIMRTIALNHPRSMEISTIYLNYTLHIKLKTDPAGETVAIVSFTALRLTGDVDYKGFNISDHIHPSLVSFRVLQPGTAPKNASPSDVMATVKAASLNNNDCSVAVSLHKKVTDIPVIDQLSFYHSDEDFTVAENQMKLIDRYYTAGWLIQRTEKLYDQMQTVQKHDPAAFLASELEVNLIDDWLTLQRFNRYPQFQHKDTLSLIKTLEINRFRKKLIDQDFIQSNVISNDDLEKAAELFANHLALYFDSSQPDFNRDTYLSEMAGSRLSAVGFNAIREFADSYLAYHKQPKADGLLIERAGALIRNALTEKASQLADKEQFSEAMSLLNATDQYNTQTGVVRTQFESVLIGKLTQRLYSAYLDFALKSLNTGIYSITTDYYQKALQLKQTYDGLILPDTRERYLADMICKSMLTAAEKSLKSNDVAEALSTLEKVVKIAQTASLKDDYETARIRLESISNRPSGYKPWEGEDRVIVIPVEELDKIKSSLKEARAQNNPAGSDTMSSAEARRLRAKLLHQMKAGKKGMTHKQLKALKDSLTRSEKALANKKLKKTKRQPQPVDSLQQGAAPKVVTIKVNNFKQQILDNIQAVHLKIWTGDTLSSANLLHQTDSLQMILAQSGDKSLEIDVRALKINLDDKRCELQKASYLRDLDLIRNQIISRDFVFAARQLQLLIAKSFPAPCKIDKSEAERLLTTLDKPLAYLRLIAQLDTITLKQEPLDVIKAYEQAQEFYRWNMIDKLGVDQPDLLQLLKSRKETPFLLKAVSEMLETNRPAYALELMKEINKLEPKPDITNALQKRLGEMLASGDHADSKTATDMLNAYNVNDRWYKELISAYKKQWKLFSK